MRQGYKQTLKKIASCTLGIPAAIVAASEPSEVTNWWVPVLAMAIVLAILKWNRAFEPTNKRSNYEN